MRKFNLFEKVEFTEKNTGKKNVGHIVGFTTDEKDGFIVNKESGTRVKQDEHVYQVLVGELLEIQDIQNRIDEFMESELCTPSIANFKDSLIIERVDLVQRCKKLEEFIMMDKFETIVTDPSQRDLMRKQYDLMLQYQWVLSQRIQLLEA